MDSVPTNSLDDNMDNQVVRHRYSWLLGAYALLVIAVPASRTLAHAQAAAAVISLVFMLLVVLSGFVVATSFRFRLGMATAAIVAALLRLLANTTAISALDLANYALFVLILGIVSTLTIRHLLTVQRVTGDTISAAICGYATLVVLWAAAYSLLESCQPGAFQYLAASDASGRMQFGSADSALPLYYSFVTITTLGYGDIVPSTDAARMLAASQAFLGQVYVAVLIARLVAIHTVTNRGSDDE